MEGKKTYYFELACFTLILILNGIEVPIPVSFMNSKILTIAASEVVVMFLGVYLICLFFKEKEKVHENKGLIFLCILYGSYCLVDYICRVVFDTFEMKSILVIKADILGLVILLVLLIKELDFKKLYLVYSAIFAVIAVILAPTRSNLAYTVYQNAAIRLIFLCVQYCVILGYRICAQDERDKKRLDYIRAIYIFSMLFCYVNALGGRVNTVAIILCILCGEVLIGSKEKKWNFWAVLLPIICVVLNLIIIYPTSYGMFTRVFCESIVARVEQDKSEKEYEVDETGYVVNEQDRVMFYEQSASKDSIDGRSQVWRKALDDIKKNPVFGVGLRQYEVTYSTGHSVVILPHNFLLEYIQAVGIAGILILGCILLWSVISIYKTGNIYLLACYGLLLLVSCMYAFVQSVFCNSVVVFLVFFNIGIIINLCKQNQQSNIL